MISDDVVQISFLKSYALSWRESLRVLLIRRAMSAGVRLLAGFTKPNWSKGRGQTKCNSHLWNAGGCQVQVLSLINRRTEFVTNICSAYESYPITGEEIPPFDERNCNRKCSGAPYCVLAI